MTSWSLLQEQETAEREAIDEHLDFQPGCEHPQGCTCRATYLARCRKCPQTSLACAHHVLETIVRLETAPPWVLVVCTGCGANVPARQWREITEFTPLGGS